MVFAAVTVWAIWKMLWVDLTRYGQSLLSAVAYVSNIYFYAQKGYFTEDATIKPLLHTWSLAVEEQFYLVAPVLLLPLFRFLSAPGRLTVLAVLVVLSFAACVVATGKDQNLTFFLAPFRAWELGLGGLLALAEAEGARVRRWFAEGCGLAGLVLIAYAALTFHRYLPFPGWRAAVPCLGAALVIMAGTVPGTLTARLLALGPRRRKRRPGHADMALCRRAGAVGPGIGGASVLVRRGGPCQRRGRDCRRGDPWRERVSRTACARTCAHGVGARASRQGALAA